MVIVVYGQWGGELVGSLKDERSEVKRSRFDGWRRLAIWTHSGRESSVWSWRWCWEM